MNYKLFLDDMRRPSKVYPEDFDISWTVVKNYQEFTQVITQKGLPSLISFDHDLAEEHYAPLLPNQVYKEKTGLDCAYWLLTYCKSLKKPLPAYKVHSFNPKGKEAIIRLLG